MVLRVHLPLFCCLPLSLSPLLSLFIYILRTKLLIFDLVLVVSSKFANGGFCPSTHPFALLDGKKCCATAMENGYKGQVETCNAGYLDLRSTCCAFGLDIPCKQEPCHDYQGKDKKVNFFGHNYQG